MFFIWCITSLLLIINSCISQQLCIDSCHFDHEFGANLTLPPDCTFVQRDQCDAVLTFNFLTRIVKVQFGTLSHKRQRDDIVYKSDNIADTSITFDGDLSVKHIVEYYCSTGDRCEYDYVLNQALPLYVRKTCQHLRAHLISLLHSNTSSSSRSCLLSNGEVSVCDKPCELFFTGPTQTFRGCDGRRDLEFQTSVGRSIPINKPEYDHRLYAYACTTELCNGLEMQEKIEQLIKSDDGECMIDLEERNQATTIITPTFFVIFCFSILLSF